ncbi:LuxR C-terminal-related transcriptional regulator [Atopomonas hussainii]|uniref:LuxR C-terminal-related transcriptional regulator n=1 Tax=Atopomonas hussainii TaxID=1429083 RepID=UPI0008FFEBA8|nr:LuxR C-terminal-related transcriptional regulator [Atopomonas hussainii]
MPASDRYSHLPRLPHAHAPRARLAERLQQGSRVNLICAPAGFGKSVLLNECVRQAPSNTAVLWLDLLGQPLTLEVLASRLSAALDHTRSAAEPFDQLCALLQRPRQPLWIVLDDYPRQPNADLDAALERLLERTPHTVCWWISGRRRPAWHLPRLLLQGDLRELNAADLALTRDELDQLLKARALNLPGASRKALLQHSEGWLAGVCLLLLGEPAELSERLRQGSPLLTDYIQHEVLSGLPEPLREALCLLAHLPRFNAELCQLLLAEQGGASLLDTLAQQQLFLLPLDSQGQWYRLWQPLAECLRRLPALLPIKQSHLLACQWFAQQGLLREAVEHAVWAGDNEIAAAYLQRYGQDQLLIGHSVAQFLHWRSALPAELLRSTPRLITLQAWALIICAKLDDVEPCLAPLANFLPQPDATRQRQLLAQYQAIQGVLSRQRGLPDAAQLCGEALAYLPRKAWSQHILCHQALAQQALAEQQLGLAEQHIEEGLRQARESGNSLFEALLSVDWVHLLCLQGHLARGLSLCQQALNSLEQHSVRGPVYARLLLLKGQLLDSRQHPEEARNALTQGLREAHSCEDAYLLLGYMSQVEQALALDLFDQAHDALRRAERQMQWLHVSPARYRQVLRYGHAWLALQQGQAEQAQSIAQQVLGDMASHTQLAPSGFYDLIPRCTVLLAQAELHLNQPAACAARLAPLAAQLRQQGMALASAAYLIYGQALAVQGDSQGAQQAWHSALSHAESHPHWPLLRHYARWAPDCHSLLSQAPWPERLHGQQQASQACPLSERECDVLERIAAGDSNQQIAERLFISLHTVKTHARRINVKLGVARRTQAVAYAKAQGWLG